MIIEALFSFAYALLPFAFGVGLTIIIANLIVWLVEKALER